MRRFGRRLATAVTGITVLGMVMSTASANAADPTPAPSSPAALNQIQPTSVDGNLLRAAAGTRAKVSLTLVTGDKVQIGVTADGKPVVHEIEPAARPGHESVLFQTITRNGQAYVIPDDALPLLRADLLDWELFNLAKLADWAAEGRTGEVPVIAEYTEKTNARTAAAVAGITAKTVLPSINARSMTIKGNGQWWREVREKDTGKSVSAARATGPLAGVEKVWLNELTRIQLDKSVPQIGAPAAWSRGYDGSNVKVAVLDSGIDATHPDLAGQIAEAVDFTDSPNGTVDGHGHGTHVASTIAGTGKASDGLRRGVAPGAKLGIGRICDADGRCAGDAVIAGMEWAAKSGYRVVNMSIGGQATNGTDALSKSVNELSRTYGTLFVIAAGNNGPGSQTVGSPGAADEALTVAAVDKSDQMAPFSSRGPRLGDGAAKPDIAAPGVAITAARAKGTAMGTTVGDYYTTASGTSMATPHMAGAAAIIAQQHPDFTGRQIKALLMGTAKDLGHDVYAQGAGRVDVARAIDPKIIPDGSLNFGRSEYPHSPVSRTVTYSNWTDEPITLTLSPSASSSGKPAPAGLFTLSADEVTVPAKGSADVTVTMDGRVVDGAGQYGRYAGALTAKDSTGTTLGSSRISAVLEPIRHDLTIKVIPPAGATDIRYGNALIVPMDEDKLNLYEDPVVAPGGETIKARVFAGTVAAALTVMWRDAAGELQQALPMAPQVQVTGATTVELDLRKAKPVRVNAAEPTETYRAVFKLQRTSVDGNWGLSAGMASDYGPGEPNWWVLPTSEVSVGTLSFNSQHVLVPPSVTMKVTGNGASFHLDARYAKPDTSIQGGTQQWTENGRKLNRFVRLTIPRLPTNGKKPVVYAGTGSAEELAKIDATGALVLVRPTDICKTTCNFTALRERVAAAAAAGAVGVLVAGGTDRVALESYGTRLYNCENGPDSCPPVEPYAALPIVSVPPAEAATLIQRIGGGAKPGVKVELGGNSEVSKSYALAFNTSGRVPASLPYRVLPEQLDRVDHRIHADRPGVTTWLGWNRNTDAGPVAVDMDLPRPASQRQLTTWVGPRDDNAVDTFEMATRDYVAPSVASMTGPSEIRDLALDRKNTIDWNAGPSLPGAVPQVRSKSGFTNNTGLPCAGCREADRFWPTMYLTSSGGGRQAMIGVENDIAGAAGFFYGVQACTTCDVSLFNKDGDELEQRLVPVKFVFQLGEPGNAPALVSGSKR
ncbi:MULTISPECIES: S8 family peptidase [unclassified Streptomyces]|uniref:S8 family peptidase n=1 Tax=unclassified Streptomyces TaxID=2593676 RepID=UPI002253789F|nr:MULTISPECIES: S8 family serine peptidase [unclassified Streptomyces]MCX4793157.1 S8 family serine peptidase [Streptomyces sp. NBC_01242]WSP59363.1 S8 family serine peptidase [Streptomyces sp. NBC_01241]WSP61046.1 S8 family serine peptidase [Streptomyces sp. NBC_01240]